MEVVAFGGLLLLGGRVSGLLGHRRTFRIGLTTATSLATAGVGAADAGTAAATFNAGQQVGGALGTALFNTVATGVTATRLRTHEGGRDVVTAGAVHGFGVALLVATGIMLGATVVAAVLIDPRPTGDAPLSY